MIRISNKANCCGCEACVQICPKHCISFEQDAEGFRYPSVNEETCIGCGLCEKVCPVLNHAHNRTPIESYAAKNPNEEERVKSSSGGIFILLAKRIIEEGGVVFGARFDKEWNVVHSYSETLEGLEVFMGSKYVQSRIEKCYIQAKEFLNSGRKVLFSGTPCQIAGLKLFLRKEYDNLMTIDLICHGVPSPSVWQEYLKEIKDNAREGENSVSLSPNPSISERDTLIPPKDISIESISFRDKRLGWKKFSFALTLAEATADGKKNTVSLSHMHDNDPYFLGFNDYNLYLRPSCMQCPTRDLRSGSDITLADFWGIETLLPEIDDDKGVSVIMANTELGKRRVQSIGLDLHTVKFDDVVKRNSSICVNSKPISASARDALRYKGLFNSKRDIFFLNNQMTVIERVEDLGKPSFEQLFKSFLRRLYNKLLIKK